MDTIRFTDLPPLHAPLDGGIFKGLTTDRNGRRLAIVLLPARGSGLAWDQAVAWAESVGGVLPTRTVSAMLHDCSRDGIGPGWHWCAESHEADGSYAWYQTFYYGSQGSSHKSYEGRAVAVRLIEVVA